MKKIFIFFFLISTWVHALHAEEPQNYQWSQVTTSDQVATLKLTGRVIPKEEALSVESARIQGRIISILKREGDAVKEGDGLFVINSPECISLMMDKQIASQRDLKDLLQSSLRREKQLGLHVGDSCRILSSISGILINRKIELGSSFNVGDALATIVNTKMMTIELDVSERDLVRLTVGSKAQISLASNPNEIFSGVVERIVPAIDPSTRTGKVRLGQVELPATAQVDSLAFAEFALTGESHFLSVPTSALVFDKNKQYVIKNHETQPIAIPIEVIHEGDGKSTVRPLDITQLQVGDQIATKGALFLYGKINLSAS